MVEGRYHVVAQDAGDVADVRRLVLLVLRGLLFVSVRWIPPITSLEHREESRVRRSEQLQRLVLGGDRRNGQKTRRQRVVEDG